MGEGDNSERGGREGRSFFADLIRGRALEVISPGEQEALLWM
jgi:hypothetical protein